MNQSLISQMFNATIVMKGDTMLVIVQNQELVMLTDFNTENVQSYNAKAVSQVQTSSRNHERLKHEKSKTIVSTSVDDQIDSSIIFDGPHMANTGITSSHHSRSLDHNNAILELASNVQQEADIQKQLNNELKVKQEQLQKELETNKDRVKLFETKSVPFSTYTKKCEEIRNEIRNKNGKIDNLLHENDKL
ncbi:hypothetical protein Tco_0776041 [Tanacetum coccineum]